MSWIKVIHPEEAEGSLANMYQRFATSTGVDSIIRVHSLRPHTLEGHMALYRNVLGHPRNTLSKTFAECIAVTVSIANECEYCIMHHSRKVTEEVPERAGELLSALKTGRLENVFSISEQTALNYAEILTRSPNAIQAGMISRLRDSGWSDGEILEINQVVGYFAYANRTVLGLGVKVESEWVY